MNLPPAYPDRVGACYIGKAVVEEIADFIGSPGCGSRKGGGAGRGAVRVDPAVGVEAFVGIGGFKQADPVMW